MENVAGPAEDLAVGDLVPQGSRTGKVDLCDPNTSDLGVCEAVLAPD